MIGCYVLANAPQRVQGRLKGSIDCSSTYIGPRSHHVTPGNGIACGSRSGVGLSRRQGSRSG